MMYNAQPSREHSFEQCKITFKLQGQHKYTYTLLQVNLLWLEFKMDRKSCMNTCNNYNKHPTATSDWIEICFKTVKILFTYAYMQTYKRLPHIKNSSTVSNICANTYSPHYNKIKSILLLLNVFPAAQSSAGNQQQHLRAYVFDHLISEQHCFCGV